MELRQLRYFLSVAKHLNFTRAAAEVHIAQPPLSRQVSNLESELGVELLERNPRGLKLTPAGIFLVDRATEILERVERTKTDAAAFSSESKRPFKIGFDTSLLYGRAPRIFRYLREHYPEYDFQYADVPSGGQARALRNGQVEFTLGRTAVNDEQIEQIFMRHDPFLIAFESNHTAYPGPDQKIRLDEIRNETFIFYGDRTVSTFNDPVSRFLDSAHFRPADTIWISDLSGALGLVAAGLGVSIVPTAAVVMRSQDVHYSALADKHATSPIVLSVMKGNHPDMVKSVLTETVRLREMDGAQIEPPASL